MVQCRHCIHKHILPRWVWSCRNRKWSQQRQPGVLGWGEMLSVVCEQWEGFTLTVLSATSLVVTPDCICLLEKFAVVISSRPWPGFHSAGHLQGRSAPFSSHQLKELHLFSVSSRPRPSEKKKNNEDEDRFFQLGGSRWMCWLEAAALLLLPPLRSSCSLACTASGKREVVSNF